MRRLRTEVTGRGWTLTQLKIGVLVRNAGLHRMRQEVQLFTDAEGREDQIQYVVWCGLARKRVEGPKGAVEV